MGSSCSCISSHTNENQEIGIMNEESLIMQKNADKVSSENQPTAIIIKPHHDYESLVKLQAAFRGYIDRQQVKSISLSIAESSVHKNLKRETLIEIKGGIPDYSNSATLAAIQKFGSYIYDYDAHDETKVTKRGPIVLENGEVYTGE